MKKRVKENLNKKSKINCFQRLTSNEEQNSYLIYLKRVIKIESFLREISSLVITQYYKKVRNYQLTSQIKTFNIIRKYY